MQFGAHRVEAVATSAVRDAQNAELFVARVKQATGIKLRIISGDDEEAYTAVLALKNEVAASNPARFLRLMGAYCAGKFEKRERVRLQVAYLINLSDELADLLLKSLENGSLEGETLQDGLQGVLLLAQ